MRLNDNPSPAGRSLLIVVLSLFTFCHGDEGVAAEILWKHVATEQGVELYSSTEKVGDQLPFKAITIIEAPYERIVMSLVDHEKKTSWAPKLKSARVHHRLGANRFAYSEYYEAPWPFHDREFLLDGTIEYRDNSVFFEAANLEDISLAADNHVRVDVEVMELQVSPHSPTSSRLVFTFSGNMGGWIPEFVKKIITRKWPIRFLQAFENHLLVAEVRETEMYRSLSKKELVVPEG